MKLVDAYGKRKWALIAKKMDEIFSFPGRTGKQCRERYHNHLNPDIKRDPLTFEQEKSIFEGHKLLGNKWVYSCLNQADIAKRIGRTENAIKNHFYSTLRRSLRRISKSLDDKITD